MKSVPCFFLVLVVCSILRSVAFADHCGFPEPNQVVIYQNRFRGDQCRVLEVGNYLRPSEFTPVPNDSISALDVGSAVRAVLYENSNFRGRQAHYEGGIYYDPIGNVDNKTSSIEVFPNGGHPIAAFYLGNYPNDRENFWSHEANGIAHDEENWFISQNEPARIIKVPFTYDLNEQNAPPGALTASLPQHLKDVGYQHFGDIDQFKGMLFVPVDGGGNAPLIAVYNTSDLSFLAAHPLYRSRGVNVGWVAINPSTEELYTSDGDINATQGVHIYTIHFDSILRGESFLTFNRQFFLSHRDGRRVDLRSMQGGTFSPDGTLLYLTNGFRSPVGGDGEGLRVFDVSSGILQAESENGYGSFNFQISSGFPNYQEAEGLDFVDVHDKGTRGISGQLHVIMLQNESSFPDAVYFKHFAILRARADLVPIDDQGNPPASVPVRWCKRDSQGRLVVTVENQGGAFAPAFFTQVQFLPGGPREVPSIGLSPGETRNLTPITIPAECFNPTCEFLIDVDSDNSVDEGINEGNNFAFGVCQG
jgi:hypothetical protein